VLGQQARDLVPELRGSAGGAEVSWPEADVAVAGALGVLAPPGWPRRAGAQARAGYCLLI
jgi:hypothetical protein